MVTGVCVLNRACARYSLLVSVLEEAEQKEM